MDFATELAAVLPADLPHREQVIAKSAQHLALIVEANQQFNLTRITDPRDAAIKHVLDSVYPWRQFSGARKVVDAGTGAGFPGMPLALVLPETEFLLVESIGKKARFVESAVKELALPNVSVAGRRAEEVVRDLRTGIITARAVAPIGRALDLFGPALRMGAKAILYKGPDAGAEIESAEPQLRKNRLSARIAETYELPGGLGSRAIVEIALPARS